MISHSSRIGSESRSTTPRWFVPAIAGLIGGIGMTAALGPRTVHPANIDWLMSGDYGLHFLGWYLYRSGPWTLPIGATPHLLWPVGSSVGLTDSIPIASIFFKVLDPWLPPAFQFIGLWLVACFALQGIFGVLLMRLVTPSALLQLLGASLFILSPPLISRLGHAALSAHWVLLAALWLTLKDDAGTPSLRRAAGWATLAAVTAAIQPYLLLMVVVMMLAAYGRQALQAPRRLGTIAIHAALAFSGAWLALWQSGSLMVPSSDGLTVGGFGAYSANLLTFIMPTEASSLLSPGPIPYANWLQYEGYAYMGLGTLLLGITVVVTTALAGETRSWVERLRRHLPLFLALIVLALMALGPTITAGPAILLEYDPRWWGPLTIFRTNGRMIWPLFYAVITAILFASVRLRHRTAVALLAVAVFVQAVDLAGMSRFVGDVGTRGVRDPLNSPFWRVAPQHFQRLIMVPPNVCDREGFVDHVPFTVVAGRDGLAINAGATARYDKRRAADYCDELTREIREGLATPGSLYVIRRDRLPAVAPQAEARGSTCLEVDGFGVCYPPGSDQAWRDAFEVGSQHRWR